MSPLEQKINDTVALKHRLDELRAQSPELADALALSDRYHSMLNDIREECNSPMPTQYNPVQHRKLQVVK